MNRRTKIRLGTVGAVAAAAIVATVAVKSDPVFFAGDTPVPAQSPLYMRDAVPPLNMLVMGKDHKIYYEAYNDASDLNGDGVLDVGYRGWELKSPAPTDGASPYKIDYFGYFDSFLCYSWNGNEFVPQGDRTTTKTCTGLWSGDFLNYATMSRMDTLRRVLYGGFRATDTSDRTVLQGAFFPQDAHSWGKEYFSIARDGYDIRNYTPLSLPENDRYHLFAVTTRSGNLATFPAYQAPMFRVLRNTTARVWNWVAMEGPVAGDHCFQQGTSCTGGGTTTPFPGHPNDRAEFNQRVTDWALPANQLYADTPTTVECTANCGGTQVDNFLTVIAGQFRVATDGSRATRTFQFAAVGDDAVDFRITQTNGTSITNGEVGWYGGHGACTPPNNGNGSGCENDHASGNVVLNTGGNYSISFRHEEGDGDASYVLRYRVQNTNNNNWGAWQTIPASGGNNVTGLHGLSRRVYSLVRTTGGASFDTDRYVRVQACPADVRHRDTSCKTYPSGSFKPVGILHDYGEGQKMYFGLITGTQRNNLQGGVLRRNVENFADEVNSLTGVFNTDVEGVVRNIDRLRMIGGAYNGGGDNISARKNWNWANSEGGLGGNCVSQGDRMVGNGECRMWGNPIAEMMFEAVRYFAGATGGTSTFTTGGSTEGQAEDTRLGLSSPTWRDPYRGAPAGGGYPACSRPVMTVISDINPSYDGDLPGSAFANVAADPSLPGFNAATIGQTIWNEEIGGTRSVFIGEVNGVTDGAPTAKVASSFGNIRGLAPEEPTKGGTYYAASVARHGARTALNSRADYPYLTTYSVALASPLPRMEIPIGDRVVELLPFAKTVSGTFGGAARKPVNTIVDFFVQEMVNFPGGASNANINGGRPYAVFRINYEDVEQGNDHDMDAIVRYTITANANQSVTVALASEYAAGSANQNIGYVISGTTRDGVYLEVRDTDSAQNTSVYELNTPANVWAGGCIGVTGSAPCNAGLTLNSTRTFTVGTAGVGDKLNDPLWYAAKYGTPAGINPDEDGDGEPDNYFLVTNPLTMREQLAKAFDSAASLDLELGSQSISGARVGGGGASFTLQPSFKRERNGKDWVGDLAAIGVNADGTLGDAIWNAAAGIPGHASRDIFTIHTMGSGTSTTVGKSAFTDVGLPGDSDAKLRLLGINPPQVASRYGGNYTPLQFIEYLRGNQQLEAGSGGTLRRRSSVLGSIINSEPVIGSPRSNFGYAMYSNSMFNGYGTFLTQKRATENTFVYVGANDGMLHAFNGNTQPCTGDITKTCAASGAGSEVFAFIPNGVLGKLGELPLPDDLFDHRYHVDGQIAISDAKQGTTWKTVLAATTGAGGRSIFALDVTDPNGFSASDVLWERNSSIDSDIGYLQGRPLVVPLQNGRWGVLFGNGYGGNTSDPALYVLDAFTGAVISKITANDGHRASIVNTVSDWICTTTGLTCALKIDPFNGLGQITAIDKNGDGRIDAVYGGDLQGNLWKFDLSDADASNWGVAYAGAPLFTAEVAGERQPVTGGIRVSAGPGSGVMVFFGTGRYQYQQDNTVVTNPQLQSLYGIFDNLDAAIPSQTNVGGRGSLARQVVSGQLTTDAGQVVRNITRNVVNYYGPGARRGWYMDLAVETGGPTSPVLNAVGERFIATPRIQSGRVFFTTYTPLEDSCSPGGLNFVYGLDLLSGAGALSDVRVTEGGAPVCTGGQCGAVAIGSQGASGTPAAQPPVMGTGVVAINPVTLVDPTCVGASCASFEQCEVVIYPGGFVLPRPCGRQSWRQLK
ncbi:PilC/PilY family type IV pilus protein [Luteimonas sp. MC1572]|nr:PilC/PilY family type IV pilus protein [Luteimonas sp. MC1572]MBJ6982627.1 hypothetical protein [Luteimonas sp. MC1572]QQO03873.1 hypothetical protein JGR64_03655 [Luteimonas sp. MC1572]